MSPGDLVSVAEAAVLLGISAHGARRLWLRGTLTVHRVGRRTFLERAAVLQLAERRRRALSLCRRTVELEREKGRLWAKLRAINAKIARLRRLRKAIPLRRAVGSLGVAWQRGGAPSQP